MGGTHRRREGEGIPPPELLFQCFVFDDTDGAEIGNEIFVYSDLILVGMELDAVSGLMVGQIHPERELSGVPFQHSSKILSELLGKHRSRKAYYKTGEKLIGHIAEKIDLFDLEGLRRSLTRGPFLGANVILFAYFPFDIKGLMELHITEIGLIILTEKRQLIAAAIILDYGLRPRFSCL